MGAQELPQPSPLPTSYEGFFRDVNERIVELGQRFGFREDTLLELVCECEDGACTERVRIAPAAYDHVRGAPGRHVVAAGHRHSGRVVSSGLDYAVVED